MHIEDIDIDAKVEKRDRNLHVEFFCELERGPNILIRAHREVVLVKDGKRWDTGGSHGEKVYYVDKQLAEIAADTVTLPDGTILTAAQVAQAVEMFTDKYRQTE